MRRSGWSAAMRPEPLAGARRVVVMRLDNIGDVVLTAPLARGLRAACPDAELTLLASPAGAAGAPLVPWYDRVETVRAVWQDVGARLPFDPDRELAFVRRLRAGDFDAAIIATSFSQAAWPAAYAAYLAGIPVRVGFAADFGGSVLSHPVTPPPDGTHQAERNLALLDGLDVPVPDRSPAVRIPAAADERAGRLLAEAGISDGSAIAVVPGASCTARRWPPERYALVCRELAARGHRIVVLGSPRESALVAPIFERCPSAVSLVGETSVPELAAVIARSRLVVCGNSLALHLADALDRPLVVLYAGTDLESEWAPRRTRATLLRIPTPCAPCRGFECPFGLACLDVEPAHVVEVCIEALSSPPPLPPVEEACALSGS